MEIPNIINTKAQYSVKTKKTKLEISQYSKTIEQKEEQYSPRGHACVPDNWNKENNKELLLWEHKVLHAKGAKYWFLTSLIKRILGSQWWIRPLSARDLRELQSWSRESPIPIKIALFLTIAIATHTQYKKLLWGQSPGFVKGLENRDQGCFFQPLSWCFLPTSRILKTTNYKPRCINHWILQPHLSGSFDRCWWGDKPPHSWSRGWCGPHSSRHPLSLQVSHDLVLDDRWGFHWNHGST